MSITSQRLFVLGTGNNTLDITQFIQVPTYKVDESPLGDSWQDSNWYSHNDIVRYKAKGSFTVWFDNINDFEAFTNFIENNRTQDGFVTCGIYINKKHIFRSNVELTIQWEPQNDLPLYGMKQHDGYEITIEER